MADYWKSNDRKYCDFCKCWITDNKATISFHENGKRHKANVAKRLSEISKNSAKSEHERQKMDADIRKMESAAMLAYAHDIHSRGDMTSRSIGTIMNMAKSSVESEKGLSHTSYGPSSSSGGRQIDPVRLPGNSDDEAEEGRVLVKKIDPETVPNASLWVEGKTDEGYTYYWNVKTNESVWEAPKEGYLSWKEYQNINNIVLKQQEITEATEAKKFRDNANEEVARYNREKMKSFRKLNSKEDKESQQSKREARNAYATAEDAASKKIGSWEVVQPKVNEQIDWQLPDANKYEAPPVVSDIKPEAPPVKRFKEKTIGSLDSEFVEGASSTFKKRKFAARGNARQRLNDD